jgi:molybdopterin synthase sulfur carrier subunit
VIRVILPTHLCRLANTDREIEIQVGEPLTIGSVLDALETRYPMLRGTIRDQSTHQRRAFMRFFACGEDLSLEPQDTRLPDPILAGAEPFRVVGAMAGG